MKFEYKLIKHKVSNWLGGVKSDFSNIDNEYNTLGDKGWELVSVTTALTEKDPHDTFFFKRLKEE